MLCEKMTTHRKCPEPDGVGRLHRGRKRPAGPGFGNRDGFQR